MVVGKLFFSTRLLVSNSNLLLRLINGNSFAFFLNFVKGLQGMREDLISTKGLILIYNDLMRINFMDSLFKTDLGST